MSRLFKVFSRAGIIAALFVYLAAAALGQTNDSVHVPASSSVSAFAVQSDGKIIVGGLFSALAGQSCSHIGRLNPNGSLDLSFNPGDSNSVTAIAIQPDGKIIAARNLRGAPPLSSTNVVRYKPDGTLDQDFHSVVASDNVECLALQSDGKILLGGLFKTLAGQSRICLGRLNTNGTLDSGFNVSITESGTFQQTSPEVTAIAVQPDGGILIGGTFTAVAGIGRTNICRLNSNGTLDTSFASSANPLTVQCLALQSDGKVLAGFSSPSELYAAYAGTNYLRRFNSDGSPDSAFAPGFNAQITCLSIQTDGKILASGMFTRCDGVVRTNVSRLNNDGTLDTGFNTRIAYPGGISIGTPNVDFALAMQNDGKLLLGTDFTRYSATTNYISRFLNTDPATDSLSFDGSTITWLRDGTAPEVWRTTFDACTNGADWVSLGDGTRITGGWQLTGLALDANTPIRARGFLTGGANNGSSWYVESTLNLTQPPRIIANDSAFGVRSNQFSFNIAAIPDQIIVIEASTNLQNWTPLSTNTVYFNPLHFTDPAFAQIPSRFYRARLQ